MGNRFGTIVLAALVLAGSGILPRAGWAAAGSASPSTPGAAAEEADYGGLPEGLGREAVYFNCTACHSLRQVTQQRLPRDEWDALLETMVRENGMHPLAPWARRLVLNYLATHFGPEEDPWQGLPPGPGRELVFGICQACHSLAIVKQQGLDRAAWEETLEWMVEEQEMPPLEPPLLRQVLDYLATFYGPGSGKRVTRP